METARGASTEARRRRVEEPFVLTAMFSLVASSLYGALHPRLFLEFFYSPALLALTHLVTLGFVTSMMMGVLYRLGPMALGVEPRSEPARQEPRGLRRKSLIEGLVRFAAGAPRTPGGQRPPVAAPPWPRAGAVQYLLHAGGTLGMIIHFANGHWQGLAWSTLLVLAAAVVQLGNFSRVFRRAAAGDWVACHVAAALVHLVLAAALGASYGFQNGYGIGKDLLAAPFVARLAAHVHLAGVGWVTTMIFGLELKLVPTTAGTPRTRVIRFMLLQGGLVGLVLSLLLDLGLEVPFALAMLAAVIAQAWRPLLRIGRHPDWAPEAVALGLLVLVALTGVALVLGFPDEGSQLRLRVELAYGYAALLGWVTLTISATAFKLFPLWVWRERFLPDLGMRPVPSVASLWSRPLRFLSTMALTTGVLATALGIVSESAVVLRVSLWVVVLGVLSFVANFVRVARWALLPIEYHPPAGARLPDRGR